MYTLIIEHCRLIMRTESMHEPFDVFWIIRLTPNCIPQVFMPKSHNWYFFGIATGSRNESQTQCAIKSMQANLWCKIFAFWKVFLFKSYSSAWTKLKNFMSGNRKGKLWLKNVIVSILLKSYIFERCNLSILHPSSTIQIFRKTSFQSLFF